MRNGKEFELKGRVYTDLTFQNRLVPNGVTARLTLTRARPEFCLMAFEDDGPSYVASIAYANLEVRKVKLAPEVQLDIEQRVLGGAGAHFPITHTVMKNFTIPAGYSTHEIDGLFMGQRPYAVTLGFVRNSAFNGAWNRHPFRFDHFQLSCLSLSVDGKPVPSHPLEPDYGKGDYVDAYETLYKGSRMLGDDVSSGIRMADYPEGYCLYVFNLTPDKSDGHSHLSERKSGNVRLSMKWRVPLPETVTLIVLGQHENTITIDGHRNVVFDYAS